MTEPLTVEKLIEFHDRLASLEDTPGFHTAAVALLTEQKAEIERLKELCGVLEQPETGVASQLLGGERARLVCPECGGDGCFDREPYPTPNGPHYPEPQVCRRCDGSGEVPAEDAPAVGERGCGHIDCLYRCGGDYTWETCPHAQQKHGPGGPMTPPTEERRAELRAKAERWLPVVGFEGSYEVSDHGRVRSLDRVLQIVRRKPGGSFPATLRCKGRVLSPWREGAEFGHDVAAVWAEAV